MGKFLWLIWAWARPIRLAWNMLCCAVLFAPFGVLPRETISGWTGRNAHIRWVRRLEIFIDWLHPHEPNHCFETALVEEFSRRVLYPEFYK